MKVLNDYVCPHCGHEEERLADPSWSLSCTECFWPGLRPQLAAPKIHLESISGDFPSATMSWEKDHDKRVAREATSNLQPERAGATTNG